MFKKIIICLIVVSVLMLGLVTLDWPSSKLEVVFCDVGQGDATLIKYGSWQMLVDAGLGEQTLDCANDNMPFWDKTIEVILITHPHQDHVGGVATILENYRTSYLLLADLGEVEGFKKMVRELAKQRHGSTSVKNAFFGQIISFTSGGELIILGPESSELSLPDTSANQFAETLLSDSTQLKPTHNLDLNERSIILYLRFHEFELMLMGDATEKNELALIDNGLIKQVEVLKVGHHGSKTSSNDLFIKHTKPEKAVISCGLNNRFGHPSPEVLQTLNDNGVAVLRTDELGSIKLVTNGKYYWFDF